jgi:hypothetical protein
MSAPHLLFDAHPMSIYCGPPPVFGFRAGSISTRVSKKA